MIPNAALVLEKLLVFLPQKIVDVAHHRFVLDLHWGDPAHKIFYVKCGKICISFMENALVPPDPPCSDYCNLLVGWIKHSRWCTPPSFLRGVSWVLEFLTRNTRLKQYKTVETQLIRVQAFLEFQRPLRWDKGSMRGIYCSESLHTSFKESRRVVCLQN